MSSRNSRNGIAHITRKKSLLTAEKTIPDSPNKSKNGSISINITIVSISGLVVLPV